MTYIIRAIVNNEALGISADAEANMIHARSLKAAQRYAQKMLEAWRGKLGPDGYIGIYEGTESRQRINGHQELIEKIPA